MIKNDLQWWKTFWKGIPKSFLLIKNNINNLTTYKIFYVLNYENWSYNKIYYSIYNTAWLLDEEELQKADDELLNNGLFNKYWEYWTKFTKIELNLIDQDELENWTNYFRLNYVVFNINLLWNWWNFAKLYYTYRN